MAAVVPKQDFGFREVEGAGVGGGCDGSWEVKPEIGLGYRRSDSLS